MADGAFRFHGPGAGPFYSQHGNRTHNRATSPHGARRPFTNDTPSPSRSPAHPSLAHNYSMYSQNGFQNQNVMNGGQNHQRFGGMHLQSFKSGQHSHHGHVNQHHNAHHHSNNVGHQHNASSGTFQSATPHIANYGQDLANGNRERGFGEDFEESEQWQEQRRMCEEYEAMAGPHERAKAVAQQSRGYNYGAISGAALDDQNLDDRSRPLTGSTQEKQSWTEMDLGGQGLIALTPPIFMHYDFLTRLNLGGNKIRNIPIDIARLKNLEFLDLSFNELECLPDEIGMLTSLKVLLLFNNFIHSLPSAVGFLHNLDTIGIFGNPLEDEAKSKFMEGGTKTLVKHLLETMPEPAPPREREWHVIEDHSEDPDAELFKVLSYNILCERYATPSMYRYVPDRVLSWEYRRNLLLNEVTAHEPDFVCFQELDKHSYDEFFRSQLSIHGYKGYFAQKSRAETLGDKAPFVDGCGTFWKDRKYIALDFQHLVLGRKAVQRPGPKASADMLNRVWQRDDIATVAFLENRVTGSRIIVANSHVFWDPAFKDVKLIQVAVMMEELSKLAEKYANWPASQNKQVFRFSDDDTEQPPTPGPSLQYATGTQIPLIVCGDYNSAGGSPVYNLITQKGLEAAHEDLGGRDYGTFSTQGMQHSFQLKSSYGGIESMPFTNYTPDFTDSLDWIFYSSNSLRVTGVLGEIDPEYLKKVPGFPNWHYPSDHISLLAEFRVESQKKK